MGNKLMYINNLNKNLVPLRDGEGETTSEETTVEATPVDTAPVDWKAGLSDELKSNATLSTVADLNSLAKQFIDAQAHIGNSIRIPSSQAGQEDMKTFHEKILKHAPHLMPTPNLEDASGVNAILTQLGKPADAGTYAIEGVTLTDEFKAQAHEMGLTQKQFGQLYANIVKPQLDSASAGEADTKAGRDLLAKEWGYAFQTKEQNVQAILEKTGAPANLIGQAKDGKLGQATLRWLDGLVTSMGSEGLNLIGNSGTSHRITPQEANAQIGEIMSNKSHPYWNSRDAGNAGAIKSMIDLQRIAKG